jgi:hypothetical protein
MSSTQICWRPSLTLRSSPNQTPQKRGWTHLIPLHSSSSIKPNTHLLSWTDKWWQALVYGLSSKHELRHESQGRLLKDETWFMDFLDRRKSKLLYQIKESRGDGLLPLVEFFYLQVHRLIRWHCRTNWRTGSVLNSFRKDDRLISRCLVVVLKWTDENDHV